MARDFIKKRKQKKKDEAKKDKEVKGRITFHKGVTIHHIEVNADFIRHHEEYPESELNGRSMENVEIDEATGESKMDL